MNTTLNAIRKHHPCTDRWAKLLAHLGKTQADDEPLAITTILESNGLDDALWALRAVSGHDREIRLYAVWCARQVKHLMTDARSLAALDVAERYANCEATQAELDSVWAAGAAAWAATGNATWAEWAAVAAAGAVGAAVGAVGAAAWAARAAAWAAQAACAGAGDAQAAKLREICGAAP
jgi:hypothetical protein